MGFSWTCKFRSDKAVGRIFVFSVAFLACCQGVDSKVDGVRESQLALTKNSTSYAKWLESSIPLYTEFYLWNWTNPEQLGDNRAKPNFVEFGPYVFSFRETRLKVGPNSTSPDDIQWNENGTVTFRRLRTWHFEPNLSNGSLDDEVVTLNFLAFIAALVPGFPTFENFIRSSCTKLSVKRKVRELLFEGYSNPFMSLARKFPADGGVPDFLKSDKFGWFDKQNNSASTDGVFNMKTGVDDIQNLGVLANWNWNCKNRTRFSYSNCGMVNRSAGELFPPKRDKTSISLFSSEIRKTILLNFEKEVEVNGTKGYRYSGDDLGDDDPWEDLIHFSFPHFLHADPSYTDAIDGMKPDPAKHQTFLDLEPETGVPLNVSATFQINFLLDEMSVSEFGLFGMPKVYIPVLWFKQNSF